MSVDVTVITPTVKGREALLERALASVRHQTMQPVAHIYSCDEKRQGGAVMKNRLFNFVKTTWFCILDDDDYLLPNHIEVLLKNSDGYDIIGSWHEGANGVYNRSIKECFDGGALRFGIPHTALVRSELFSRLGKFSVEQSYDTKFWEKAFAANARINIVQEKTWYYDLDEGRPHESLGGLRWDGC